MSLILHDLDKTYVESTKTNILKTFKRIGWTPPSESPWYQEKWRVYKHLAVLNAEKDKVKT